MAEENYLAIQKQNMVSAEEAKAIVLEYTGAFGTEVVDFMDALGRVLREPVFADRDFPPFDRISMDGIGIRYADYRSGCRSFRVAGVLAAGQPPQPLAEPNACLEVMTGAVLPDGLDTVVPYEQLSIEAGRATLQAEELRQGQNIHRQGLDRRAGDLLIQEGTYITSAELGVLATVGKARVRVSRLPRALVISSGDELVDIDATPEPHQIRKSNVYQLSARLMEAGILADLAHLDDDFAEIQTRLSDYLERYELLVLSGGVSKGKFDFLPDALEAVGVQRHFHRVAQRPGKPFWFGTKGPTAVFAFPGNPVSSFVCLHQYLLPWLRATQGLGRAAETYAVLGEAIEFKPALSYFVQVKLASQTDGTLVATPHAGGGSGDLANLLESDGFLELPPDRSHFRKGEAFRVERFRWA